MWTSILKVAYLRIKFAYFPNKAQKFWGQELLNSQGITAKIGQILGQGKGIDPPKSTITPQKLQHLFFKTFEANIDVTEEVYAASIGQVFFVAIDGNKYALKILHPGIKQKIKKEISNIIFLGKYFSKINGFSFNEEVFQRFLTSLFEEETDLCREALFQEKFHQIFESDKRFKIPTVSRRFSNHDFLCQELVRSDLASNIKFIRHFNIFDFFFESLINHGTLHGDLNDRNWGLTNEDTVVVYDYGCTQIVSERRIGGLLKLLNNQDVVRGFQELGIRLEATWFKGKEQDLRDTLFNPLLSDPITPDWSYSKILKDKYGDKIKILREYADPWVLLMMRSLFSLIRNYQSKNITIPFGTIIKPFLEIKSKIMSSTNIKVEVFEDKKQIVYMILPMTSLNNLQDLMPDNVCEKILEEGIDLKSIIEKVKETEFMPQDLFNLNIRNRNYRVWID